MVMLFHVDARAMKHHSLSFQPHSLLEARFAAELDSSAGTDDAVPGQSAGLVQGPSDLPGRAGKSRGVGDVAVGRDLATRNAAHLVEHQMEHRRHTENLPNRS